MCRDHYLQAYNQQLHAYKLCALPAMVAPAAATPLLETEPDRKAYHYFTGFD
jgi:hypothetical protein